MEEESVYIMQEIDPYKVKCRILGAGLTIQQVSQEAGISNSNLTNWLNGKMRIRDDTYNKVMSAFRTLTKGQE